MRHLNQKYSTVYEIDERENSLHQHMRHARLLKFLQIFFRIFIIGVMVALFLSGCTKKAQEGSGEGRKCWTCITVTITQSPHGNTTSSAVDTVCNKNQQEIQALIDAHTYTKKYGGGVSVIVNETCQ